jgi:hypothetical protein
LFSYTEEVAATGAKPVEEGRKPLRR